MIKTSMKMLAVASILAAGITAANAESKALWTAEGFKNPESVLSDGKGNYFVSNVNGTPLDKDGNGFISRMTATGEIEKLEWIKELNAPKGMVMKGDKLFVTDIDELVEIDPAAGTIVNRYPAQGAIFLNDPAVGPDGTVYVSDIAGRKIFALQDGKMSVWFTSEDLMHPNGLRIEDGKLIVAGWGREMNDDGSTKVPGNLFTINLETKELKDLGGGQGIGNLDGLEKDANGDFIVTDFMAGALYRIKGNGTHTVLVDLNQGSADLEVTEDGKTAIIPMMMDGKVTAYSLD